MFIIDIKPERNMPNMFKSCIIKKIYFSNFNIENIGIISGIFGDCASIVSFIFGQYHQCLNFEILMPVWDSIPTILYYIPDSWDNFP